MERNRQMSEGNVGRPGGVGSQGSGSEDVTREDVFPEGSFPEGVAPGEMVTEEIVTDALPMGEAAAEGVATEKIVFPEGAAQENPYGAAATQPTETMPAGGTVPPQGGVVKTKKHKAHPELALPAFVISLVAAVLAVIALVVGSVGVAHSKGGGRGAYDRVTWEETITEDGRSGYSDRRGGHGSMDRMDRMDRMDQMEREFFEERGVGGGRDFMFEEDELVERGTRGDRDLRFEERELLEEDGTTGTTDDTEGSTNS